MQVTSAPKSPFRTAPTLKCYQQGEEWRLIAFEQFQWLRQDDGTRHEVLFILLTIIQWYNNIEVLKELQ